MSPKCPWRFSKRLAEGLARGAARGKEWRAHVGHRADAEVPVPGAQAERHEERGEEVAAELLRRLHGVLVAGVRHLREFSSVCAAKASHRRPQNLVVKYLRLCSFAPS